MTAVAEGAARFAAEHGVSASARTEARPPRGVPAATATKAWLQFPSVSGDLFPFVVGRVEPGAVEVVRFEREDGAFRSNDEKVGADGSFVAQVELAPRSASTFRVVGLRDGKPVAVEPATVTMRHGVSLADPPLSRTIGIALAGGSVAVYFERGAPMPARKTFRLHTSFTAHPAQKASAIVVPVVQGEAGLARLCRLVGCIDIRAELLSAPLPAGAAVDVVLELDRGGRLTGTAHVPDQGVTVPGALVLMAPDATLPELEEHLARLRASVESLYADTNAGAEGHQKRLSALDTTLSGVERELEAAAGGDADALEKVRRLLIDADGSVADLEAARTWPELEAEGLRAVTSAMHWVSRSGGQLERSTLEEAVRSLERARVVKNAADYSKRLRSITIICNAAIARDDEGLRRLFDEASERMGEMHDPRAGKQHIDQGRAALAAGDSAGARKAFYAVWALLPPPEEVRAKAHGSGVER